MLTHSPPPEHLVQTVICISELHIASEALTLQTTIHQLSSPSNELETFPPHPRFVDIATLLDSSYDATRTTAILIDSTNRYGVQEHGIQHVMMSDP